MSGHGRGLCSEGDDVVHVGAVAFGGFFQVRGCEIAPHLAIRIGDADSGLVGKPQDVRNWLFSRGATLEKLAKCALEWIEDHVHHDRPEVVLLRKAPGAAVCTDAECDLSGGYAHIGPCEDCGCGKHHAIDECPDRDGCYESVYRLLVGVRGTIMHGVRTQFARIEELHPGCLWTIGGGWAVAWREGEPVGFVGGSVDKEGERVLSVVESLASTYFPCGKRHQSGERCPHDHAVAEAAGENRGGELAAVQVP